MAVEGSTELISLECACGGGAPGVGPCAASIQETRTALLQRADLTVTEAVGCGKVQITYRTSFETIGSSVYDANTGALLGMFTTSDSTSQLCGTSSTQAGAAFDCDDAAHCRWSGTREPDLPSCEASSSMP